MQVKQHKSPKHAAKSVSPIDRLLDAQLFKALSDPTRLRIFACLTKCARPCSVKEVAECCAVDLSVVSRHLSLLARAGILESSREGQSTLYQVRFDFLSERFRKLAAELDGHASCAEGCCVSN